MMIAEFEFKHKWFKKLMYINVLEIKEQGLTEISYKTRFLSRKSSL